MAKFTRAQMPELDERSHDRIETVQYTVDKKVLDGLVKQRYRSENESKILIAECCKRAKRPVTRSEIAKALNRSKSPTLLRFISELVNEGVLRSFTEQRPNGVATYWYEYIDPDQAALESLFGFMQSMQG